MRARACVILWLYVFLPTLFLLSRQVTFFHALYDAQRTHSTHLGSPNNFNFWGKRKQLATLFQLQTRLLIVYYISIYNIVYVIQKSVVSWFILVVILALTVG